MSIPIFTISISIMNNLLSSPAHYLRRISCPVLPAYRMDDLKEREPSRAGDLYTAEIGQTVNTINHQRNAVKLIMARWPAVDPVHYPTILGVSQNNSKSEDVKAVVSMVNIMQTSWIGQSSWVQGYIKGETDWHDLQAHINNLNRFRLLLKVPQENETPVQRTARRALQRAYKEVVRIHIEHTQAGDLQAYISNLSPRDRQKAGRLEHTIKKVVDTVNTMPTHKMTDPDKREPRDTMNLVTARYSQVDPIHYSTVLGGGQANAGQLESAIKKSVDTITSNWIGTPSWLQAFVEGETCCSDYQVIINNLHRMSKLLKLIPEGETPKNRALRLTRREAYKKALRAHQEHVRLGVEAEIQTAEDAIEDLSTKDGVTQVKLQGARDELPFLRGDREDLVSQYTLEPLKATPVCQSSAIKSLVRSSLDFPDNKALAYAEFKCADSILYLGILQNTQTHPVLT
ncbi:uncharacterized protein J4E78_008535 [Alternaria triticimaculans]|uniref:uncharacterized protein n=1 Tax=Alternaria triticimaculans TaxID=297637 RepID=UPI0020C26A11|nr:uncharacterized protein J4E78_008535 [Alternaria triticimaculans]KAI4649017.1 hypothetical protein J4E78_008535 [Alternaria triticimaculans]